MSTSNKIIRVYTGKENNNKYLNLMIIHDNYIIDNNNKVVVGDIQYNNTNTITISFDKAFVGCAFLN